MNDLYDSGYLPDGTRVPSLPAVASDSGQTLRVWCRYCARYHSHGRNPDDPIGASNGHRVAHCAVEDSPYRATGYDLFEVEGPLPEPAHVIKPRYTRRGDYVSGYLARQRRELERRR